MDEQCGMTWSRPAETGGEPAVGEPRALGMTWGRVPNPVQPGTWLAVGGEAP
ncbi:MAG: hypothetical protein J2P40_12860 [Candidatus Dormibacteraeota bacterium]|nr:hypothetical protein [Candidatus Dormibacteraeota bacterium]MBO0762157.1 hypothetical protein [Candidatus Dormibacteraeota bacterium]